MGPQRPRRSSARARRGRLPGDRLEGTPVQPRPVAHALPRSAALPLRAGLQERKKFSYYVCQSLLKRGRDACDAPQLNARRFESLVIDQIRANILTESNIRNLVRLLGEQLDGVAREQRQRLKTIESELADVRRRLDRLYHLLETTELDIGDVLPRVREKHKERRERLEEAASEARAGLSERRVVLDKVETITAYAQEMSEFLATSELTESEAFIRSFVKETAVAPSAATIRYTIPMPEDSPLRGGEAEEVALGGPVLSTVKSGGPGRIRTCVAIQGARFTVWWY